jgi:hypothetical protein
VLLLPGENYSEQLMFTLEAYKETWVDGRAARLYAEAYAALNEASELSSADKKAIQQLKSNDDGFIDFALDLITASRKAMRFSKAAAPLILADGPLPFGDVVFAAALGIDFAIAAYNVVDRND